MPSTTVTTASIRARLAGAVILLSCISSVGCATTGMTASSARVPVLVGPVACIDCSAASPSELPHGALISDSARSSYPDRSPLSPRTALRTNRHGGAAAKVEEHMNIDGRSVRVAWVLGAGFSRSLGDWSSQDSVETQSPGFLS